MSGDARLMGDTRVVRPTLGPSDKPILRPVGTPGTRTILVPDLPKGAGKSGGAAFAAPVSASGSLPRPPVAQVVQRVTSAVSRGSLLQSLLSDPAYAKSLQGLSGIVGVPTASFSDTTVMGVKLSGNPAVKTMAVAKSYTSLDWHSGITFSPNCTGPKFSEGGVNYNVGGTWLYNATLVPGASLKDLAAADVDFISYDGSVWLYLEVPPEPGAYMFVFRAADSQGVAPMDFLKGNPPSASCSVYDSKGEHPLKLVGANNLGGFTCLANIYPGKLAQWLWWEYLEDDARKFWGMRTVNCVVRFTLTRPPGGKGTYHPYYFLYGGITMSKL